MENNENIEETQETVTDTEQVETQEEGQEETVEDLKAQVAKYKAIADRTKKKLQTDKPLKTNENLGLSREEAILITQGMKADELDYLNKIKGDKSYLEAQDSSDFKNWLSGKKSAEARENSQLGASNGSPAAKREKSTADLSDKEFKDNYGNIVEKALNG